MINFKPIEIDDKERAEKILKELKSPLCAHCFVDLFIWRCEYDTQIYIADGFVFVKQSLDGENVYTVPLGKGDFDKAIRMLKQDAVDRNVPFVLHAVSENKKAILEREFPDKFDFQPQRDSEDYIYSGESLMTLQGKKLHSKRNFINRFKNEYEGRWCYEDISEDNLRDVFDFHLLWCTENSEQGNEFWGETCAISIALKNFDSLGLRGGLIRIDGKVIAFTIGSAAHDEMFIVHIEKANHTIAGAYQMINNQFALRNFEGIEFINREEDLGKEGLRKSKLSYYPVKMGANFNAVERTSL